MKKATPYMRTEWPRFREETHPKVRQSRLCERGGTLGRLKTQDRTVDRRIQEEQSIPCESRNRHKNSGAAPHEIAPECLRFFRSGSDFRSRDLALIKLAGKKSGAPRLLEYGGLGNAEATGCASNRFDSKIHATGCSDN